MYGRKQRSTNSPTGILQRTAEQRLSAMKEKMSLMQSTERKKGANACIEALELSLSDTLDHIDLLLKRADELENSYWFRER